MFAKTQIRMKIFIKLAKR